MWVCPRVYVCVCVCICAIVFDGCFCPHANTHKHKHVQTRLCLMKLTIENCFLFRGETENTYFKSTLVTRTKTNPFTLVWRWRKQRAMQCCSANFQMCKMLAFFCSNARLYVRLPACLCVCICANIFDGWFFLQPHPPKHSHGQPHNCLTNHVIEVCSIFGDKTERFNRRERPAQIFQTANT